MRAGAGCETLTKWGGGSRGGSLQPLFSSLPNLQLACPVVEISTWGFEDPRHKRLLPRVLTD